MRGKMKVLWVCNIMLPVIAEQLGCEGSNKEGWLSGLCDTILERQQENGIELHVAYPVKQEADGSCHTIDTPKGRLYAYGFYEDTAHAEQYEEALEGRLSRIIKQVQPDVIHCFGTEFAHTLAVARCCEEPKRVLVGIQGVCQVIADCYMADLPEKVQRSITFRDWLKKDSILQQQEKFRLRGSREAEILKIVGNVTGRTEFDHNYAIKCNPSVRYFSMNETLRSCYYEGEWKGENCEPHTIFMSQGDYPLKGLHYMLLAAGKLKEQYTDLKICVAGNSLVKDRTLKDKIKLSAYGKYLRQLIRDNDLQDSVHFLGRLSGEEMKEQYLKCGLYVCCSSNENSPNSLGEAMLLGVPCVAADVGGISSLFVHGQDGILYQGYEYGVNKTRKDNNLEKNVDNLAAAISEVWNNKEKTKFYCQNARKHAKITHDKEENYKKMMEIYAKISSDKESDC